MSVNGDDVGSVMLYGNEEITVNDPDNKLNDW